MTWRHSKFVLAIGHGALLALVFSACSRRPLMSGGTPTPTTEPTQIFQPPTFDPTTRRTGIRDFRRLLAQLSSALNVPVTNAQVQSKLIDAFSAPPQVSGTPGYVYVARTLDFVQQMNYQTTDQKRSTALEANRLRVVSAFCEVSVAIAAGFGAADARRGIYLNVNLAQMLRADAERFLRAAALVFRRDGQISDAEIEIVATTMATVASTVNAAAGWSNGCTIVAGDSLAGEL